MEESSLGGGMPLVLEVFCDDACRLERMRVREMDRPFRDGARCACCGSPVDLARREYLERQRGQEGGAS